MDKGGHQRREEKQCISRWEHKTKRVRKTDFTSLQNTEIQEGKRRKEKERKPREKGRVSPKSFLWGLQKSSSHLNDISSKLTKHVFYNESKDKNLVFSPLSLHLALSLVAAGPSHPIRAKILSFFGSDSIGALKDLLSPFITVVLADGSSSGGPHLASAFGVWVDQSLRIKEAFQDVDQDVYKAGFSKVDFHNKHEEARNEVNLWVEEKTRSLIKQILPKGSVDSKTVYIVVNAIYFKGVWVEKTFDASMTKDHEFHFLNGQCVRIPFMTSWRNQYISAYDGFKVLELPYNGGDYRQDGRSFRMCIFLPDDKDGLPVLVDKLVSETKFVENHKATSIVKVGQFLVPKFKLSFGFEATEILNGLGLDLKLVRTFHKSFIEVNEKGTKAAAATAVVRCVRCRSRSPEREQEKLDFVADHPFLFLIKENTSGVVLFAGTVLDPTTS